jgi:hypothetical protein
VTERGVDSAAVSLRREVLSRAPVARTAWLGGLGAVGIGLYLALVGMWLVAVVSFVAGSLLLWLGGAWDLPWSRDGYLRRLSRVWTDWTTGATWADDVFSRRQSKLTARLDRLSPPPSYEDEHAHLESFRAERERLRSQESLAFADRASRSVALLRLLSELAGRLDSRATTDAERRYVAVLEEVLAESRSRYATAASNADRVTEQTMRKLGRLHHPASVRVEHAQLVDAFRAYLATARAFRAACEAEDPDRVATSARDLELAQREVDVAGTAISERLDYDARWPVAASRADPD